MWSCGGSTVQLILKNDKEAAIRFSVTIALILVLSAVGLTYEIAAGRVLKRPTRNLNRWDSLER